MFCILFPFVSQFSVFAAMMAGLFADLVHDVMGQAAKESEALVQQTVTPEPPAAGH